MKKSLFLCWYKYIVFIIFICYNKNSVSNYQKYDRSVIYVKNTETRDSFIYIVIDDRQMKYAVCYPGRYQDVLEFTDT